MKNEFKYKVVLKTKDGNEIEIVWLYAKSELKKAIEAGVELYNAKSYFVIKKNEITGESEVLKNEY